MDVPDPFTLTVVCMTTDAMRYALRSELPDKHPKRVYVTILVPEKGLRSLFGLLDKRLPGRVRARLRATRPYDAVSAQSASRNRADMQRATS